jgi:hypothetical protein
VLLLIEYSLGLLLQRNLSPSSSPAGGHRGHYSFRVELKRNEINGTELGEAITTTDLLLKALSQTLQDSPALKGHLFHGIFFPAQPHNPCTVSLKSFSQHSIARIHNAHLLSLDEIHLCASEVLTKKQRSDPSRSILSFVFHLIQTHLFNSFQQLSYGFAMVAPFPSPSLSPTAPDLDLDSLHQLKFVNSSDMSHSSLPIFVSLPHGELLRESVSSGDGDEVLPISVTIHNAILITDAVKFVHLLKRNLILLCAPRAQPSPSSSPE